MKAAAVALAIAAAAFGWWQYQALANARADLLAAQGQIAGLQELDKFRRVQLAADAAAAALDTELSMGVGGDAPLSDYMRRSVGRVWP